MIEIVPELEGQVRVLTRLGRPSKITDDPMTSSYIFDGLRIQTEFYEKQLQDELVDVTCYRYRSMTHAFIDKLGFVPQAEDLANVVSEAIKNL